LGGFETLWTDIRLKGKIDGRDTEAVENVRRGDCVKSLKEGKKNHE